VGPEALEPLNLVEEFVFLHHAPSVALSEEWLIASHMLGYLWLGPWLALRAGREPRIRSRFPSIGSLRLG
jgi:hypothetical protein